MGGEEEMAVRFWENPTRMFEYRSTLGFFGKVGTGRALFASGVKV
jgi:hypothetical protein